MSTGTVRSLPFTKVSDSEFVLHLSNEKTLTFSSGPEMQEYVDRALGLIRFQVNLAPTPEHPKRALVAKFHRASTGHLIPNGAKQFVLDDKDFPDSLSREAINAYLNALYGI